VVVVEELQQKDNLRGPTYSLIVPPRPHSRAAMVARAAGLKIGFWDNETRR
jgi:hypothetical protein